MASSARRSRRPARRPAKPERRPTAAPVTSQTAAARRTVSWLHCLIGLVAGEAILLLLSNLGLLAANAAFGSSGSQADGGIVGVSSLLAVMAGAYVAARLAGHHGIFQGIVVACGFILWGAVFQFLHEAGAVATSLSAGGHTLIDLGPMDMGSVVMGDLLALFGGTVGGLLSGKR